MRIQTSRLASLSLAVLAILAMCGCQGPGDLPAAGEDAASVECGPNALLIALNRLGIATTQAYLLDVCTLTPDGTQMGELARVARTLGADATISRCGWNDLLASDGTWVLFVGGDHFVAVDPRQRGGSKEIRLYDPNDVARWVSRRELEGLWQGESLRLKRPHPAPAAARSGPVVQWTSCWEDAGYCYPSQKEVVYRLRFRNAGNEPLLVEVAGKSCDCTDPELVKQEFAPGETGECKARVLLYGKRGRFAEKLVLRTNDPAASETTHTLAGGVYIDDVLSSETIYFGEVYQGSKASERFVVHDPGSGTLLVQGVKWAEDDTGSRTQSGINCISKVTRVERDSPLMNDERIGRYDLRPGDYVIDVTLSAAPDAIPGPAHGKLEVQTNLTDHRRSLPVSIDAAIRSDLEANPRAVLLSNAEGGKSTMQIRFDRRSGLPCVLDAIDVEGAPQVSVDVHSSEAPKENEFQLEVQCDFDGISDTLSESVIQVRLTDGTIGRVPVVVRKVATADR